MLHGHRGILLRIYSVILCLLEWGKNDVIMQLFQTFQMWLDRMDPIICLSFDAQKTFGRYAKKKKKRTSFFGAW